MDRRQFLKGAVLATTAAGVAGIAVAGGSDPMAGRGDRRAIAVRDRLYRLDGTARVLVSKDKGATWAVHSNFAPRYSAERMKIDARGQAWLLVRHENRRFNLRLSDDGAAWRTA